jgi:heme A synthase
MTLSDKDKQLVYLELEKSHFNISNATAVFNRATLVYFIVLIVTVIGFVNGYINAQLLNTLVFIGVIILIVGMVSYLRSMVSERKKLNELIEKVKGK